jgi:hypothetical protein
MTSPAPEQADRLFKKEQNCIDLLFAMHESIRPTSAGWKAEIAELLTELDMIDPPKPATASGDDTPSAPRGRPKRTKGTDAGRRSRERGRRKLRQTSTSREDGQRRTRRPSGALVTYFLECNLFF